MAAHDCGLTRGQEHTIARRADDVDNWLRRRAGNILHFLGHSDKMVTF